ncbi:MAG: hypothetical protein II921_10045 [Treponema sp.]|nr:hypothetical protein [Treponema sp.]
MKVINTYNESNLHFTLKKLYALETDGKTEVPIAGTNWICDVVSKSGDVVEIQTTNISALTEKTAFLLSHGRNVKIVHPVIFEKRIETLSENGDVLSRRKSPKKDTVYSTLRGLTKIAPLLGDERLTVELLYVSVTEIRQKTAEKVQLGNKSRRHLKSWIPAGKRLEKILKMQQFSSRADWARLFPEELRPEFTRQELHDRILSSDFLLGDLLFEGKFTDKNRHDGADWYTLLIWLGKKCNLIEECGKRGRKILYRRTDGVR